MLACHIPVCYDRHLTINMT